MSSPPLARVSPLRSKDGVHACTRDDPFFRPLSIQIRRPFVASQRVFFSSRILFFFFLHSHLSTPVLSEDRLHLFTCAYHHDDLNLSHRTSPPLLLPSKLHRNFLASLPPPFFLLAFADAHSDEESPTQTVYPGLCASPSSYLVPFMRQHLRVAIKFSLFPLLPCANYLATTPLPVLRVDIYRFLPPHLLYLPLSQKSLLILRS